MAAPAPTFMLIPSLACQASCSYCFGPHKGAMMDERSAKEAIRFIKAIAEETSANEVTIIFHGGEPLLAPFRVWETLLDEIRTHLSCYALKLSVQSNLWNLDGRFIQLFKENNVSIGTSMDGPKEICDINRGEGYFDKTSPAVQKARMAGCPASAIATITKQTMPHVEKIAQYFRDNDMPLVLHGALPAADGVDSPYALTSREYGGMIRNLFPWYIKNRKVTRISTLDNFVHGIVTGRQDVCTFRDCFGMFLAVSPSGDITSCQRLAGKGEYALGNIFERPTLKELYRSKAAEKQQNREKQVSKRCSACEWISICKGGCYYNAVTSGDGVIDPWCEGYKEIYNFVQARVIEEMQSSDNIGAVTARPAKPGEHPLLRKGAYISLADKMHPSQIADNARRILALHELCKESDSYAAAQNLFNQNICGCPDITEKLLTDIQRSIHGADSKKNNCYVHLTFDCNLRCNHCYASAGESRDEMPLENFERLIAQAIGIGFRQVVITGGEPLVHTRRDAWLDTCRKYRGKGANLVLRTNLTGDFVQTEYKALAESLDQVVVSVDGNEQTHDARRGAGTYENVVRNLEGYVRVAAEVPHAAELSLACVLRAADINGKPGQSVRRLGERLQVRRVRFRPLLPLGRAAGEGEPLICEGLMQHVSPEEMLQVEFRPLSTCGIGQNLFVQPDGGAYPCYAWHGLHTHIGNVFAEGGLSAVLGSQGYVRLMDCTVDTIDKCKQCDYRYLCGGACRAWGNQDEFNLNAAPAECDHLKERAQKMIEAAREYILAEV